MPKRSFDAFLKQHAPGYRADATPDAEAVWQQIAPDVSDAIHGGSRSRRSRRIWLAATTAIAATLVLGVVLGRWTARAVQNAPPPQSNVATLSDSARLAAHLRASTQDYMEDADVFLTDFRAGLRTGGTATLDRAQRSRELLARTRLLLHGSQQQSPEVMRLLEDLELLLAEIAAMPERRSIDATLLQETLRRDNILSRLRTRL